MWIKGFRRSFEIYFHYMAQRWKLHQFKDDSGINHFYEWYINELNEEKQKCVNVIISNKLLKLGPKLVETKWLKIIKGDLYQLRVMKQLKPSKQKILLRLYICFDANHQVTVLSGYDKGIDPSRERQTFEIEKASKLLEEWRSQNEKN